MPMAEDAFRNPTEAKEIIEQYNEDDELKWREQHKIRVREQKQREAVERREREQLEVKDDTNIMDILERAELMEELENELEELDVVDDEHLRQHLQSNNTNGLANGDDNASHSDQGESDDDGNFNDEIIPDEFQQISRAAANMCDEAKLKFYENQLCEIGDYLSTRKFNRFEDLKELADKRGVQECLRNAIDEINEEKIKGDREEKASKSNGNLELDETDSVCPLSPPDGRKCITVAEFKELEKLYLNRSNGVALVFYKSQLRSVMKSIASCSKDAHVDHMNDKRELYEYINDSIDCLRAEILREKQAKLEEKFVDDDTDNEAPANNEDGLEEDIGDDMEDNVPDSINVNASNDDIAHGVMSAYSPISPTKRKICFAAKPSVTTYHLDDEPWRVQNSSGETDETTNTLMDQTFQFFNSPSSSSSGSVCDYDVETNAATSTSSMKNSTNKCDDDGMKTNLCRKNSSCDDSDDDRNRLKSISQDKPSASKTLYYKDGSTLYLKFAHTVTPPQQSSPIGLMSTVNAITSPVDIYEQFSCDIASVDDFNVDKQKLKDYVMKMVNLNTDELHEKMANYLAGKSASSSLPNGNNASPVLKTSTVEPKKSILKNCEAVKREVHGQIYEQIEDDGTYKLSSNAYMIRTFVC